MPRYRIVALLLVSFALAACGDSEPTQRKAFIEFLQTRIVAKPGVHVPKLTTDETAAFGPYAKHYAVIADFNAGLDQQVSQPLKRALETAPRSLDQLAAKRAEIVQIKSGMAAIRGTLDQQLAKADAERAALKQPDDLKPVFDAAYDRDVTQPAKAFAEIFPDADAAMAAILAVADFLDQHRDAVKVEGALVRVSDPALQSRLHTLLEAVRAKQDAIRKAQQRLRELAYGP